MIEWEYKCDIFSSIYLYSAMLQDKLSESTDQKHSYIKTQLVALLEVASRLHCFHHTRFVWFLT